MSGPWEKFANQSGSPASEQDQPAGPWARFLAPQQPAGPVGNASAGGVIGGIKMGFRDPIDAGAQMLVHVLPDGIVRTGNRLNNWLADVGVPGIARLEGPDAPNLSGLVSGKQASAASPVDRMVESVNSQYSADRAAAGRDGIDLARLTGNVANPVNIIPGNALMKGATGMKALAIAGAKAGALGGALQPVLGSTENFWTDKAEQAGAGAAAGAVMTPLAAKAGDAIGKGLQRVSERFQGQGGGPVVIGRGGVSPADLDVAVNRLLQAQGMKAEEMPPAIIDSIKRQIGESLTNRGKIDPAAALRQAQAEAVGLTGDAAPTLGQLTREPMRYAQERNMSGIVINTPQGPSNPLATRFTNQNQRLQDLFDTAGAKGAVNAREAGAPIMDALRQADEPVKAGVDELYTAARGMNAGRAAELDRGHFNQTVNAALDEGMWGQYVPAEVRGMMNDIASGKSPFNVDAAVQIDSILSAAQRGFPQKSPQASAIGVIRDHLNNTPFAAEQWSQRAPGVAEAARAAGVVDNGIDDVAFREVGRQALPSGQRALPRPSGSALATEADMAMPAGGAQGATAGQRMSDGEAARQAFEQARQAARSRFSTIEDTPALKAALEGEAPDDFVRKYVLGGKAEDLRNLRQVLQNSPEALAQARAQIADHLKRAAFGENLAGDKVFAPERYAQALRNLGPDRLRVFFDPQDVMRFNLAGKVAADINSEPAGAKNAVNYSASSSALFNLFQKIIESPLVRNVPGVRSLANQAGEIANERAVQGLAVPGSAVSQQPRELSPEAVRALQRLFAPAAVGAGAAAGSGV